MNELLDGNDAVVEEFHGMLDPWEWCRASWIAASRDERGAVMTALFAVEDISSIVAEQRQREQEHSCWTNRPVSSAVCLGNSARCG